MGLFSFIKNAGSKLFKKKEANAPAEVAVAVKTREDVLEDEVRRLGLSIDNLNIELSQQVTVSGSTMTNSDREKVILALGNVEGVGCVDDRIEVTNPEPESTFHEVKGGDTLSKIAKEVYGDAMKYNSIFEANKPMLSHPDKIYPGQILRIPAL